MLRGICTVVLLVVLVMLALSPSATAASESNWADVRLDAIASSIAAHPVNVYCEDDWRVWIYNGEYGAFGFTASTVRTVFINPRECATLHGWLAVGSPDMGAYWLSIATLTLVHESMHQRLYPVNLDLARNEAYVECLALKEYETLLTSLFGVPALIDETYLTPVVRKVRVGKKVRRLTTWVPATRQVPNPLLSRLVSFARAWDSVLPPQYRGGTC